MMLRILNIGLCPPECNEGGGFVHCNVVEVKQYSPCPPQCNGGGRNM
jgi:hypothetical protein